MNGEQGKKIVCALAIILEVVQIGKVFVFLIFSVRIFFFLFLFV